MMPDFINYIEMVWLTSFFSLMVMSKFKDGYFFENYTFGGALWRCSIPMYGWYLVAKHKWADPIPKYME